MKVQAKLYGTVHDTLYLSHMREAKAQMSLHICTVPPQPLLLALKK